jgi:hypothetical protein
MTPDQLAYREALKYRFNVLVSTCQHTVNPVDDLDGWRRRWVDIQALVGRDQRPRLATGPRLGVWPRGGRPHRQARLSRLGASR